MRCQSKFTCCLFQGTIFFSQTVTWQLCPHRGIHCSHRLCITLALEIGCLLDDIKTYVLAQTAGKVWAGRGSFRGQDPGIGLTRTHEESRPVCWAHSAQLELLQLMKDHLHGIGLDCESRITHWVMGIPPIRYFKAWSGHG